MNILILTWIDCSGAGYALMDAINKHTLHHARLITDHYTRYKYPTDVMRPGTDELWQLIEWADVYNFQIRSSDILPEGAPQKPTVRTYHGTGYRKNWRRENEIAKERSWVQTCLTLDLSVLGAQWVGRAIPNLSHMHEPDPGFHVAHAGAPDTKKKRNRKGTAIVEAVAAEFEGVTFDIFREVSNDECLWRKAKAHLYIDQIGPHGMGYGTNALEAWALGMPVITEAPDEVLHLMREKFGRLPFSLCHDAVSLRRCIIQFRDSPELRIRRTAIGRRHVRRWHSPEFVAQQYLDLFKKAIDDFV